MSSVSEFSPLTGVPPDPELLSSLVLTPPHDRDDVVDVPLPRRVLDDAAAVVVQVRLGVCDVHRTES